MATKQLIALTAIVRTVKPGKAADPSRGIPPVRPEVKTIPAGAIFTPQSQEQENELIGMGAARYMTEEEVGEADPDLMARSQAAAAAASQEPEAEPEAEPDDELEALRAEYEDVIGSAPHANMKAETMRKRIDDALDAEDMV